MNFILIGKVCKQPVTEYGVYLLLESQQSAVEECDLEALKARNMCKIFSLVPSKIPVTREN